MEIQVDLRNIHGKLARFMAYPVLPVYARRLRGQHILSDKGMGRRFSQRLQENICIQTNHVRFLRPSAVLSTATTASTTANFNCRAKFPSACSNGLSYRGHLPRGHLKFLDIFCTSNLYPHDSNVFLESYSVSDMEKKVHQLIHWYQYISSAKLNCFK